MTDDFTSDALRYLLGDMDPGQQRAFSERLARDPVAARAFKDCADSLAGFAVSAASPKPVSEFEREASLAAVLAQVQPAAPSVPRPPRLRGSWVWPIAAAVLLGLNLLQFLLLRSPRTAPDGAMIAHSDPNPSGDASGDRTPVPRDSTALAGVGDASRERGVDTVPQDPVSPESSAATPTGRLGSEIARLEALRREYASLQQARDSLDREYNAALQHLARRALTEQGIGRLAAMELVDANSYARGDRKGLLNLARDLLTEPGIVALDPSKSPRPGDSEVGPSFLPSTGPAAPSTVEAPYAWSVFDEKDNRGYLNLYNLPSVATSDTLQVWVKPAGSEEFQPVGQVPAQYYGRSGSVSYDLPAGSATPSEVLVTLEPRQNRPARPSGPVILRGP